MKKIEKEVKRIFEKVVDCVDECHVWNNEKGNIKGCLVMFIHGMEFCHFNFNNKDFTRVEFFELINFNLKKFQEKDYF
jgi:hypothetical protein